MRSQQLCEQEVDGVLLLPSVVRLGHPDHSMPPAWGHLLRQWLPGWSFLGGSLAVFSLLARKERPDWEDCISDLQLLINFE
jgi:hypothetical protein